jgi:hypothetical protein
MAKDSPTSRTLEVLREQGYTVAIVEKWNPHVRIRQDLFGFIDILAIKRDETLAVQATASGVSERIKKIMASEFLPKVREAGWKIQVCFVATPMYGGMTTGYYCQSLVNMTTVMRGNDIDMSFSCMFNESLIQRGRNALAHGFLNKKEATHLMFIDADIKWNPADIVPMIEADKDIICGIYPKKEINWHGVEQAVKDGVPADQLKTRTGSLVVNLVDYQGTVTVPAHEPVEIWNGGTGFMLIKRSCLEDLATKMPSYINDVTFLSGEIKQDKIVEFFACAIEEGVGRLLSEDYYFCQEARRHGYKIYAAPWVVLGHFGSYLFEGGLLPAP